MTYSTSHLIIRVCLTLQYPTNESNQNKARSNDYVEEFHTVKSMQDITGEEDTEEKGDTNPYASLGDLEPLDLISFAYQIAVGMVRS